MNANEKKIDQICHKEGKVKQVKEWLGVLFFLVAITVLIICYKVLSTPITDHGKVAGTTIIITLSVFAGLIISGYFYNQFLSKKLDRLYEQKSLLF